MRLPNRVSGSACPRRSRAMPSLTSSPCTGCRRRSGMSTRFSSPRFVEAELIFSCRSSIGADLFLLFPAWIHHSRRIVRLGSQGGAAMVRPYLGKGRGHRVIEGFFWAYRNRGENSIRLYQPWRCHPCKSLRLSLGANTRPTSRSTQ